MPQGELVESEGIERAARVAAAEGHLVHDALAHQVAAGVLRQVSRRSVALDVSAGRLEQPRCQTGERGLPRSVRPGERDDLAAAQLAGRAVEHDRAVAV